MLSSCLAAVPGAGDADCVGGRAAFFSAVFLLPISSLSCVTILEEDIVSIIHHFARNSIHGGTFNWTSTSALSICSQSKYGCDSMITVCLFAIASTVTINTTD